MTAFHIIIPARYDSRRLPGKPLADIAGKPMIAHVAECALQSDAASVSVATDDARIAEAVATFGGAVVMTSAEHNSGSDRIAEAADKLQLADDAIVLNLQGDEPQMPAALMNQTAKLLARHPAASIATLYAPIDSPAELHDPAVVKVVTDRDGYALYFSRAAIPYLRDADSNLVKMARRHIGLYAYRAAALQRFAAYPPCELEMHEKLEQLRALWYGEKIICAEAAVLPPAGIDTPADLARIRREIDS